MKQMLLRLCVVVALGWLLKSKTAVAAEHAIPPFVAEGRLLTQEFRTDANLNPPPFDNGYTELQLKVIESTNLHGITFPIRVVCKRFTPNWGGKDRDDLRVELQSELTVTRISFAEKDVAKRIATPYRMFAEDVRLGVGMSYAVHDDQWQPVSDPEIKRRARAARQRTGNSE